MAKYRKENASKQKYSGKREPTLMYCLWNSINYNKKLHDDIRKNNSVQDEIFADPYANQNGYGVELISTFHKHNQHFDEEIDHFEIRVEKINNKELFNGFVKPIDRNGW